jgi:hypothetical protein
VSPVRRSSPDVVDRLSGRRHQGSEFDTHRIGQTSPGLPQTGIGERGGQELLCLPGAPWRRSGGADASADLLPVRVERQAERSDGDHHRVPRADLAELLRTTRQRDADGCD